MGNTGQPNLADWPGKSNGRQGPLDLDWALPIDERSIGMNKCTVALIAVGIAVLCLSSWAMGDAAGDYETLFGQAEKTAAMKVRVSPEFAARLLKAAKMANEQKDLQAILCEKAYEFGIKTSAGYTTAADAMKLLIETTSDKKIEAQEKLLTVHQLRYKRSARDEREKLGLEMMELLVVLGDDKAEAKQLAEAEVLYRQALRLATTHKSSKATEIVSKIEQVVDTQKAEQRIAALKARLNSNPKGLAARRALITAYLGELDDPGEAVKLLTPDLDEGLRTYVPLAAKNVNELEEDACIQLAEWLVSVAERSYPADKSVLMDKAKACCDRFLKLHTIQDVGQLKGKLLLDKVKKAIEKAGPRTSKTIARKGNVVDLLKLIDPKRDAMSGTWQLHDGVLRGVAGSGLQINYQPPEEYDYVMEFQTSSTLIEMACSKGNRQFMWGMKGWCHRLCGFEWIDGKRLDANPTKTVYPMSGHQKYTAVVQVRNDGLRSLINGKVVTEYKTDYKALSNESAFKFRPGTLGLFVYKHVLSVYRLEVVEVTGSGKRVAPKK